MLGAVREFASRGYRQVSVVELAGAAGVTTGSLYHHFGSKLQLYRLVRSDVERRVLDRMEGAAAARADNGGSAALRTAILVGFDWATSEGFSRLLAEPHPGRKEDPLTDFVVRVSGSPALSAILLAAWRAALQSTVDGETVAAARTALSVLRLDDTALACGAGR